METEAQIAVRLLTQLPDRQTLDEADDERMSGRRMVPITLRIVEIRDLLDVLEFLAGLPMEPLDAVRDVMYFADEYASEYARSYDSLANAERANLSAAVMLALATEMERAATVCDLVAKDGLADNGIATGARECARRIRALIKVEMPSGTA